jgi:hypothetical protein
MVVTRQCGLWQREDEGGLDRLWPKYGVCQESREVRLEMHLRGESPVHFLSVSDVVALHEELLARTGGLGGLRDVGLLESAG